MEDEDARKTAKLTTKTPEDYYRKPPNDNEEYKRFKELYGAKTDFSISNYENNYNMMNEDEQIIFTSKAQTFLNLQGYRDKEGYQLKEDGIFGPKTKGAFNEYKKDSGYKPIKDIDELDFYSLNLDSNKNGKPNINGTESLSYNNKQKKDKLNDAYSTNSEKVMNKYNYFNNDSSEKANKNLTQASLDMGEQLNNMLNKGVNYNDYKNLLSQYATNSTSSPLSEDYFQYEVLKLLRSIDNIKNSYGTDTQKHKDVLNLLKSILKTSAHYSDVNVDLHNYMTDALSYSNFYNIKTDYHTVIKKWFRVFVESCKDKYSIGNHYEATRAFSPDMIDSFINQIINQYNWGYKSAIVKLPTLNKDIYQIVYTSENGLNDNVFNYNGIDGSTSK